MIPAAFEKYLYHFHVDRDYFECHEILEEYWKEHTDQQKNSIWVGFILLAVSNYHHRRNNFAGATRTLEKAISIFKIQKASISNLGLIENQFFELIESHLLNVRMNKPYLSYSLPIFNTVLLNRCYSISDISRANWGRTSDLTDESLIHRHKHRDRSIVIAERQNALLERKRKDNKY
jgi:uncharacterized protein